MEWLIDPYSKPKHFDTTSATVIFLLSLFVYLSTKPIKYLQIITKFTFIIEVGIGATKKGPWGALGPPNKEQNWENKEQNGGKKLQNCAFLGCGNS